MACIVPQVSRGGQRCHSQPWVRSALCALFKALSTSAHNKILRSMIILRFRPAQHAGTHDHSAGCGRVFLIPQLALCAGVRAALLPFTLKQMHASTALMSEWRLATRRAAMRHAQTGGASTTSSTRTQSAAPASMGNGALRSAASTTASATSSVSQTTATAEPDPSRTGEFGEAAPAHSELASCTGDGSALRPAESEMKQIHGRLGASDENDRAQPDSSSSRSSNNMDTRPPRHSRPDVRSILDEYRRVRGESRAPSAAWLLGSPLLQVQSTFCGSAMTRSVRSEVLGDLWTSNEDFGTASVEHRL